MKFNKLNKFYISKKILSAGVNDGKLDYEKWTNFIDTTSHGFIWKEKTEEGQILLRDIGQIPEDFRARVLGSLNKILCFKDYNNKTKTYNISAGFNNSCNWISIQFARNPNSDDLKIFLEMANYLDALLLYKGTQIISEQLLAENF